jgi:hypothetical protein
MLEKHIEAAILDYLNYSGWFVVKLKDQCAVRNGVYRKPPPYMIPGVADIYALKDGRSIWFEVKNERGKQSEHQKSFGRNIKIKGGEYYVVRSIDEVKEALKQ